MKTMNDRLVPPTLEVLGDPFLVALSFHTFSSQTYALNFLFTKKKGSRMSAASTTRSKIRRSSGMAASGLLCSTLLLWGAFCWPMVEAKNQKTCQPSCQSPFGSCVDCSEADDCVGEYCKCTEHYRGEDCSLRVAVCPASSSPTSVSECYNGGLCVARESFMDTEEIPDSFDFGQTATQVWRCDCSTAIGSASTGPVGHAGAQCEYKATQSCIIGDTTLTPNEQYAFCVNGGDCIRKVASDEKHPGCSCIKGFEGRHCQYAQGKAPPEELAAARADFAAEDKEVKTGLVVFLVFFTLIVLGGLAYYIVVRKRVQSNAAAQDAPVDLKLEELEVTEKPATPSEESEEGEKAAEGEELPPVV